MPESLTCKLCDAQVQAWEYEVYDSKIYSGLLRIKCIKCGFESTIRIYDKDQYKKVLSHVIGEPMIFDFRGE